MSGDLVSDVPPGAVAAAHRRHDAVVTAMLSSAPVSGPSESGSSTGKDKTKKPGRYNIIGLDPTRQFLLYIATGFDLQNFSFVYDVAFHVSHAASCNPCQVLKLRKILEYRRAYSVQLARYRYVNMFFILLLVNLFR